MLTYFVYTFKCFCILNCTQCVNVIQCAYLIFFIFKQKKNEGRRRHLHLRKRIEKRRKSIKKKKERNIVKKKKDQPKLLGE